MMLMQIETHRFILEGIADALEIEVLARPIRTVTPFEVSAPGEFTKRRRVMTSSFSRSLSTIAIAVIISTPLSAGPPVVSPFSDVIDDVNPCTGEIITLTFAGTVRVHEVRDHFVAHYSGTVITTDGGVGHFRVQQVFHGERVSTQHNHDMEAYENGQRVMFTGIFHTTLVDGEIAAEVEHVSLKCVGKR